MCLQCVSVVHLIVATRSSGPPASGKIIKEMPISVASGTPYITQAYIFQVLFLMTCFRNMIYYCTTLGPQFCGVYCHIKIQSLFILGPNEQQEG